MNQRFTITAVIAISVGIVVVCLNANHHQLEAASTPSTRLTSIANDSVKKSVHIYFADKEGGFLVAEKRSINAPNNPMAIGKAIIDQLIKGPEGKLMPPLPADTTLRDFFLTPTGIAVLDFNKTLVENHPGGVRMELLTLYAIVNSVALNMDEVNAVQLLINGRESITLAGHLDIRFPYKANMLLIK